MALYAHVEWISGRQSKNVFSQMSVFDWLRAQSLLVRARLGLDVCQWFHVSLHQSDFAATGADRELKDSSATAIVASAFVELAQWGTFVCLGQRIMF
jgi:hypothetical protein